MKCSQCNGSGCLASFDEEEYSRGITDICYHCSGTGKMDSEAEAADLRAALIEQVAAEFVAKERKARDNDPEGEGWAFCAAENMLSVYEYTQGRIWDCASRLEERLRGKVFSTREELIAQL